MGHFCMSEGSCIHDPPPGASRIGVLAVGPAGRAAAGADPAGARCGARIGQLPAAAHHHGDAVDRRGGHGLQHCLGHAEIPPQRPRPGAGHRPAGRGAAGSVARPVVRRHAGLHHPQRPGKGHQLLAGGAGHGRSGAAVGGAVAPGLERLAGPAGALPQPAGHGRHRRGCALPAAGPSTDHSAHLRARQRADAPQDPAGICADAGLPRGGAGLRGPGHARARAHLPGAGGVHPGDWRVLLHAVRQCDRCLQPGGAPVQDHRLRFPVPRAVRRNRAPALSGAAAGRSAPARHAGNPARPAVRNGPQRGVPGGACQRSRPAGGLEPATAGQVCDRGPAARGRGHLPGGAGAG